MLRKNFITIMLLATLVTCSLNAQSIGTESAPNTARANASAILSLPIAIFAGGPIGAIDFGGFIPGTGDGTIVLDPSDETRNGNGVILIDARRGHAGRLDVSGEPNALYQLSFTSGSVTLQRTTGAETMTMTNITTFPASDQFILDATYGRQDVQFGGTLNVSGNQQMGFYVGTFQITANYQ